MYAFLSTIYLAKAEALVLNLRTLGVEALLSYGQINFPQHLDSSFSVLQFGCSFPQGKKTFGIVASVASFKFHLRYMSGAHWAGSPSYLFRA